MTKQSIILGIESSCDETACAIITQDCKILANIISSQASIHASHGGVVPEVAAREHLSAMRPVITQALKQSDLSFDKIDGIAATGGPGLIGGILVGSVTAKAIASASNLPYYAVNHLEGHALTPRFTHKLGFPYLLLLVSGGHTQLLNIKALGKYERYGTTLDDAAGEALDLFQGNDIMIVISLFLALKQHLQMQHQLTQNHFRFPTLLRVCNQLYLLLLLVAPQLQWNNLSPLTKIRNNHPLLWLGG